MVTILIADDEAKIRRLVADFLKREGYNILEAGDGEEAITTFEEHIHTIDLVILDVMMPINDGWSVLRSIKSANPRIPVMMLTARSHESDEVFGFDLGADDYIGKPFSPVILTARVKSLLRKSRSQNVGEKKVFGNITIDEIARVVTVDFHRLSLSPKEYELLIYLTSNQNIAVSREQMLNFVWGYDYFGDTRTVDTHVKKLRAKLGRHGEMIKTVRNYGYRFEVSA